jgi:predicted nucleic acid-binding protein
VIYVDTSVVLAQLLAEDRHPGTDFWESTPLVSSRLLEYEAWTRVNGRGLGVSHGDELRSLLGRLAFLELAPPVLTRALEPFPTPVRTLDALHLASLEFLRALGQRPRLATYDHRLADAASMLSIPLMDMDAEAAAV